MQAQYDPLSVGRRPLDVEDYIDIARRHKAWILGPVFAALVISVVVAFLWPDTYVSTAVIRLVPPQVPERYVPTNINIEMSQRVSSMAQTILSRSTLTNIIQTYGLYPRDVKRKPMEDVIEEMKKNVRVGMPMTNQQTSNRSMIFPISFAYENPILAQKVVEDLVSRFINENTRERSSVSIQTTEFLRDQVESAKKELDSIEQRLMEFRLRNQGRLPEERSINIQALHSFETQRSNLNAAMSRIEQDKLLLESRLQTARDFLKTLQSAGAGDPVALARNERLEKIDREIQTLEQIRTNLLQQYKETYPDVRRIEGQLNAARRTRETILKEEQVKKDTPPVSAPSRQPLQVVRDIKELEANVSQITAQIQAKDVEREEYLKEIAQVDRAIKNYQERISSSPVGEQQYTELVRDYENAKKQYQEFQQKQKMSSVASDLESRKQGETLELLDPASRPVKPTEPTRWLIIAIGTSLGVVLGLFLAGGREMKDTSLKNLKDVRAYTQLAILGSVPLLENDLVVRRRRRMAWLAWSTAFLVGILIMSGSVYYYFSTRV
jgi:polysaccharide chain length determinant protein (PEP-CTERM system associated)